MWGSWFVVTIAGLLALLGVIGVAFGTAALLFPLLIAAALGLVFAVILGWRRSVDNVRESDERMRSPLPRDGGAPASGEGSGSRTGSGQPSTSG